tara:strand:+ start:506 stop:1072 length:567 start_codon:yes stop_codon:yes gene_type:complete
MHFLEFYNNPKNIRFSSFKFALNEANNRGLKTFVETGVARGKTRFFFINKVNWLDGMSTMIFSDYVKFVRGQLYSCDIQKKNIENAKKFTKKNESFIEFIQDDSLNFLKNFNKKIDFLYLDSLDGQFKQASVHQLNEIKTAEKNLHENSLVLLDDKGQKTSLSLNYMIKNKFKIINETKQQVLLSRKS